ncbi:MAG: hypothetical protein JWM68_2875 [Verrucomicrobiales bacterium]|nr:hypothetical protein [Verrucomicrobiales bacterium]
MKLPVLLTALVCSSGILCAQQSTQPSQSTDTQTIDQGAGAQPSSSSRLDSDTSRGRAFSTNNPPSGRPFQENPGLPPGQRKQNIKEGEQSGIPTQDPAGAQRPDANAASTSSSSTTTNSSSATGNEVISSPKSGELRPGDPGYAAGAQRTQATELQNALSQIKMSATVTSDQRAQLQQTLTSMVTSKTVQPQFITRLSEDLSTSLSSVQINEDARVRLANAIAVILGAQAGSQTQVQQAFTETQSILLTGPNTTPLARATVCDLHLIATELVPGLQLQFAK